MRRVSAIFAVIIGMTLAMPGFSQQDPYTDQRTGYEGSDRRPAVPVTVQRTDEIVQRIAGVRRLCDPVPYRYRVSCILMNYRDILAGMPGGEYEPVRDVIEDTVRKLERVINQTRDREAPSIRVRGPGGQPSLPYRPVQEALAPQANRAAESILAEAETLLLRSASENPRHAAEFTRIAEAVGSNKVLLRSA